MESDRFDRLVKSLASVDTRRGLLRLLPSGPLAAGLATRREEASGQGVNGAMVSGGRGRPRRHQKRHDPGDKKDRRHRKRQREDRRDDSGGVGDPSVGQTCVPLDQLCNPYSPIRCCGPTLTNSIGSRSAQSLSGVPRVLPPGRHHRAGVGAGLGRGEVGGPDAAAAPMRTAGSRPWVSSC